MDLQTVFYIVGIIFMVLAILILVGIVILVFYIKKKVDDVHTYIEAKVSDVADISLKPVRKVTEVAKAVLTPSTPHRRSARTRKRS